MGLGHYHQYIEGIVIYQSGVNILKKYLKNILILFIQSDVLSKLDENHCRFIRRLIHYYKPSSNRFSHQDLGHGRLIPPVVMAGIELIDWLSKTADVSD